MAREFGLETQRDYLARSAAGQDAADGGGVTR